MIREKVRFDDDRMTFLAEQDVSGVLDFTRLMRDVAPKKHGEAAYRLVGSIPRVLYDDIVRRLGPGATEQEINKACKKFLTDGDHAAFVVRGF